MRILTLKLEQDLCLMKRKIKKEKRKEEKKEEVGGEREGVRGNERGREVQTWSESIEQMRSYSIDWVN